MSRPSASLATRVLLVLCIATVMPTLVVGALAMYHAVSDVQGEVIRGNLALIRALGAALDARLQDTRRALEIGATSWAYQHDPDNPETQSELHKLRIEKQLSTIRQELPLVSTVTIVDRDNNWLHGDPKPVSLELKDISQPSFGGYISDIMFEGTTPTVFVVLQARDRLSRRVGYLIAQLKLTFIAEALQTMASESRLGTGARLLVVDGDGRPIARSDGLPVAKSAPSLRNQNAAVAAALRSPDEGSLEHNGIIAVYGNIGSYQQTQRAVPWAIVLEQPTEHAYALARVTMRDTVITGVVVLAVALLVGVVLATRLTKPLHDLAERADAIAGARSLADAPPAPLTAPGEIGTLARRIDEMAQRIGEREKLQSALARGDRLATVGTMAASVAHEINNPLTTVLGYANLLLEGKGDSHPDRAGLSLIADEAKRMKRIVGNLLDYSRSDRAPSAARGIADVNSTLRHTADLMVPQLRGGRIELELRLAEILPQAAADPHALQQVFVNLVQNAAQAMPDGGSILVTSQLAPGDVAVEVCVMDQGPGVPAEDRARIFEPFFTTKEAGMGTGLGLAVCKHLVTSAGGSIDVTDSPSGRGACFRVRLPIVE